MCIYKTLYSRFKLIGCTIGNMKVVCIVLLVLLWLANLEAAVLDKDGDPILGTRIGWGGLEEDPNVYY